MTTIVNRRADSGGLRAANAPTRRRVGGVLVVNRFRVEDGDVQAFRRDVTAAHVLLAQRPGYVDGTVGRNLDEPSTWLLMTRWENVGSYRRALSSYDVKLGAVPLLSRALDEPSAYEIVAAGSDTALNEQVPRSLD